jgi:hypothetical protein
MVWNPSTGMTGKRRQLARETARLMATVSRTWPAFTLEAVGCGSTRANIRRALPARPSKHAVLKTPEVVQSIL